MRFDSLLFCTQSFPLIHDAGREKEREKKIVAVDCSLVRNTTNFDIFVHENEIC